MTGAGELIRIGNHEVRVEGDIVFTRWDGPATLDEIKAHHAVMERVIAEKGRVFNLIDMRGAHQPPPEARRWMAEWSTRFRVNAVAGFGASFAMRTISMLLVRAIRILRGSEGGPIVFVATEAEARAFLKSERARLHQAREAP
jgi:hypothetical protein